MGLFGRNTDPALLLGAGGLVMLGRGLWCRRRQRRSDQLLRSVWQREPEARLAACAELLRRAVAAGGSATDVAHLSGEAWLQQLDRRFATDFFTAGAGRVFGTDLYRRDPQVDWPQLERALRRFLG